MSPAPNETITHEQSTTVTVNNAASNLSPKPAPVKALNEHRELDAILEDLLNNQGFEAVNDNTTVRKREETTTYADTQDASSVTVTTQKTEITEVPVVIEERHYTITQNTDEKMKHVPKNAFTYTIPSVVESKTVQEVETVKSSGPEPVNQEVTSKTYTLPYRTDYENTYTTETTSLPMDSDSLSWLEMQQQKLRQKKEEIDGKRTHQEKALVEELKFAQSRYAHKRAQSDAEEQEVMQGYSINGPTSPITVGGYTVYQMSVNAPPPPQRTHRHQPAVVDEVFDVTSPETYGRTANKPPPSPGPTIRATNTPPVTPPVRTSSKEYMQRQRSNSRDWPPQQRPQQRSTIVTTTVTSNEGTVVKDKPPMMPTSYGAMPPLSPPLAQSLPTSTYSTYETSSSSNVVEEQHTVIAPPPQFVPAPAPEPIPEPEPEPALTASIREPVPEPEPAPAHKPISVPVQEPIPEPEPAPAQNSVPVPTPAPEPAPEPAPAPATQQQYTSITSHYDSSITASTTTTNSAIDVLQEMLDHSLPPTVQPDSAAAPPPPEPKFELLPPQKVSPTHQEPSHSPLVDIQQQGPVTEVFVHRTPSGEYPIATTHTSLFFYCVGMADLGVQKLLSLKLVSDLCFLRKTHFHIVDILKFDLYLILLGYFFSYYSIFQCCFFTWLLSKSFCKTLYPYKRKNTFVYYYMHSI